MRKLHKIALVTGSNTGIGASVAVGLAEQGCRIAGHASELRSLTINESYEFERCGCGYHQQVVA